jgi:hypothetical protein
MEEDKISSCVLAPCYTGDNEDFFKENVFLDESGILSDPVSMRKIFLIQSLNIAYFGKLHISPIRRD